MTWCGFTCGLAIGIVLATVPLLMLAEGAAGLAAIVTGC